MLILRKALVLLRALARDNTVVQQRIFDRLDELLEVQGVEDEIASALVEVRKLYKYMAENEEMYMRKINVLYIYMFVCMYV